MNLFRKRACVRFSYVAALSFLSSIAQAAPSPALPQVSAPPAGDPRLEPIPSGAVELVGVAAAGNGEALTMAFPPRVNGQNQADGDRHADLWVLFNASTGARINQPPVVETTPYGAVSGTTDLSARMFSANWDVHALLVDGSYDPGNPATRIDAASKIGTSLLVVKDYQTNIYFNGPVVPNGSVSDALSPQPIQVYANSQLISLVPYEVDDGPFPAQIMFRFTNASGQVLGAPYLVASHVPGQSFYSPIYDIVSVQVPNGFDITRIQSETDVTSRRFPRSSAQIRVNAPVIAIGGTPVTFVDPFSLLTDASGKFDASKFPFARAATATSPLQEFAITQITAAGGFPIPPVNNSNFPLVANGDVGNVIPLILSNPLQLLSSGPNSAGPAVRFEQADLDNAHAGGTPKLPPAIEANFAQLISAGLLAPEWAPNGGHSYQERLSLVGQALFERVWQTPQGADPKDVVGCLSCHSLPMVGGAGRNRFNLPSPNSLKPNAVINPASIWGDGPEELLYQQLLAAGVTGLVKPGPFGGTGIITDLRSAINGAANLHFGIQTTEFVAGSASGVDATTDKDHDGVANEMSAGEVTAMTAYLLTFDLPHAASADAESRIGISDADVRAGKKLFRTSTAAGGAGCASCHTVFMPLKSNVYQLGNPQTASVFPITLPVQTADQDDVADGLAQSVGQIGLHMYGDLKVHNMGSADTGSGTSRLKTAELWDAASTAPYLRDGSAPDLLTAIEAHTGVTFNGVSIRRGAQTNRRVQGRRMSEIAVTMRNVSGQVIEASAEAPLRLIVTGALPKEASAANATPTTWGSRRQGAFWSLTERLPAGASKTFLLQFDNPQSAALRFDLAVQTDAGYSEAVASSAAFAALSPSQQNQVISFLRAQTIDDYSGE